MNAPVSDTQPSPPIRAGRAGPAPTPVPVRAARRRALAFILLCVVVADGAAMVVAINQLETLTRDRVASLMREALSDEVEQARLWFDRRRALLRGLAENPQVMASALRLIDAPSDTRAAARLTEVERTVGVGQGKYLALGVAAADGRLVFDQTGHRLGDQLDELTMVKLGMVDPPRPAVLLPFRNGRDEVRGLGVVPLRDGERLAGWLLLPVELDEFLAGPLATRRLLDSGELYAFDFSGVLLSQTRFMEELRGLGLIPPGADTTVLGLELRDPGQGITRAPPPEERRSWPLTRMVAAAITGEPGEDFEGYLDPRGVRVFGVWHWLEDPGLGLAVELDEAEALAPVRLLQPVIIGVMVALGGLLAWAGYLFLRYRQEQRRARAAQAEAERLGQYQLVRKLGEGGMGVVYEGQHTLLHRAVAIKVMQPGRVAEEDLRRFEREARVTASLAHPNTVSVYDFGLTDAGGFYYVMELLAGADLESTVFASGPMGEARAAHLLRQVCGSLAEAHAKGLVHRDIKPSNIFVLRGPAVNDVAKLLDFGLVRPHDADRAHLTRTDAVVGTPLYMAPELFQGTAATSPASDVYALGAVAYFMLTARHLFDPRLGYVELADEHRAGRPRPPAEVLGRPLLVPLQTLIDTCLAKSPADRPTLAEVEALLGQVPAWSSVEAEAWWARHGSRVGEVARQAIDPGASATAG